MEGVNAGTDDSFGLSVEWTYRKRIVLGDLDKVCFIVMLGLLFIEVYIEDRVEEHRRNCEKRDKVEVSSKLRGDSCWT